MFTVQIIDGKYCPVLLCDKCSHPIEGQEDGIAIYENPGDPLMFLHRECEDEDAHQHHLSMEIPEVFTVASATAG